MLAEKLLVSNWSSNKICFFLGDFQWFPASHNLKCKNRLEASFPSKRGLLKDPAGVWKKPCQSKKLCDQHVVASQDQKLLNQLTGNWRLLVEVELFLRPNIHVMCVLLIYVYLSVLCLVTYFYMHVAYAYRKSQCMANAMIDTQYTDTVLIMASGSSTWTSLQHQNLPHCLKLFVNDVNALRTALHRCSRNYWLSKPTTWIGLRPRLPTHQCVAAGLRVEDGPARWC